jgi:solute:Na+ symporter, SSS family
VALWLQNALQAFQILLQIGAGTGLVFLLRWFWWRITA